MLTNFRSFTRISYTKKLFKAEKEAIIYMAGFFDGEGHISVYKANNNDDIIYVKVGVTNTVLIPLLIFNEMLDGHISKKLRNKINPKHKNCYELQAHDSTSIYNFLCKVLPYLIIKKDKAIHALVLLDNTSDKASREEAWKFFGSRMYADNNKRYELKCDICGNTYYRSHKKSSTCSRHCRSILIEENKRNGVFNSVN